MLATYGGFWDTWNVLLKISFDPTNKLMIVHSGVENIDVGQDLYSAWKIWAAFNETDNLGIGHVFRTFGGDDTIAGQVAPQYFFLVNGWRILVDGQHVNFATNLYTDEGDSPFVLINSGTISNATADVPVITNTANEVTLTPQEIWEYANRSLSTSGVTELDFITLQNKLDTLQNALQATIDGATIITVDVSDTKIMVTDAEHRVKYEGAHLVFNKPTDP